MNRELSRLITELLPEGTERTEIQSGFGKLCIDRQSPPPYRPAGEEWRDTDADERTIATGQINFSFHYDSAMDTRHPHGSEAMARTMLTLFVHWMRNGNATAAIEGFDPAELEGDSSA